MPSVLKEVSELQKQQEEIQKQIQAKRESARAECAAEVQKVLNSYGFTLKDIKPAPAVNYVGPNGEVWSGRGKHPAWVKEALAAGKSLESFRK